MTRECHRIEARESMIRLSPLRPEPSSSRLRESVTDMRIRQKVFGISGVILDFHANLPYECTQVFELISVFGPPNRSQEPGMWNWSSSVRHQVMEHFKLFWREVHRPAVFLYKMPFQINRDVSDGDFLAVAIRHFVPAHG